MKRLSIIALILIAVLLPLFMRGGFYMHILIMTVINIILATSLWLILRVGQLSIGHAAFMAIGAYASALFTMKGGLPFWLATAIAPMAAAVVAMLVGYPTLRLKGLFFALVTFAMAEILRTVLTSYGRGLFGGTSGIWGIPKPSLLGLDLSSDRAFYYFVVALMIAVVLVIWRIGGSRIGMVFSVISQADNLAESLGINIMRYKMMAFVLGSYFAGLAGSLYAHYSGYISPEHFTFWMSVYMLIYVVVGGANSIAGPIIGACALSVFHESLRTFGHYEPIVYGFSLMLVLVFLPGGLISLPQRLPIIWRRIRQLRAG